MLIPSKDHLLCISVEATDYNNHWLSKFSTRMPCTNEPYAKMEVQTGMPIFQAGKTYPIGDISDAYVLDCEAAECK